MFSPPHPPKFIPEMWSSKIMETMREQNAFFRDAEIDPRDTWGPTNETFAEAVAWAKLLGMTVMRPDASNVAGSVNFRIVRQGYPPLMFPICSPPELVAILRAHASPGIGEAPKPATVPNPNFIHHREKPSADKIRIVRRGLG